MKPLLSALALLLGVLPAAGQAISRDVAGSVTDASGTLIPGISLTTSNDQTGVKAATTSDGNGQYRGNHRGGSPVRPTVILASRPLKMPLDRR